MSDPAILLVDPDGRVRGASDPHAGMIGRSIDEVLQELGGKEHAQHVPIRDQSGATIGEMWMLFDEQHQAKVAQTEKMASLGMLVAGIAHEINTPIGAISSMHDTLIKAIEKMRGLLASEVGDALTQNPKIVQTLKIIEDSNRVISDGSSRVMGIVRRLRSFARLDEADLKDADVNEGIVDTLGLIGHELKRGNITVVKNLGSIPRIACYPGRLNQVFLNMLMNARQAIGGGGQITVSTWLDGGRVKVSIADTGVGIAPENLPKLFEPGFTTKGVGIGTGLGLSICHQICEEHHGAITVESEVGKGTTFTVEIPINLKELTPDQ
jgi:two-component system, NtrC family, sensor kinase